MTRNENAAVRDREAFSKMPDEVDQEVDIVHLLPGGSPAARPRIPGPVHSVGKHDRKAFGFGEGFELRSLRELVSRTEPAMERNDEGERGAWFGGARHVEPVRSFPAAVAQGAVRCPVIELRNVGA
jgi:hypothetical protein